MHEVLSEKSQCEDCAVVGQTDNTKNSRVDLEQDIKLKTYSKLKT